MRLTARLALPLVLAAAVTAAITAGLALLLHRTASSVLAQSGQLLAGVAANALAERAQALRDQAVVDASLRGSARDRDRAWHHPPVTAVAVLETRTGRVRSAWGPPLDATDLAGLVAARPGAAPLVRAGPRLLVAGIAAAEGGREAVVVAQPVDDAFAGGLKRLVSAEVVVEADGRTVAASFAGDTPPRDADPARAELTTPGGGAVVVTAWVPGAALHRAQRGIRLAAFGGGLVLLLAAAGFYAWTTARVTGPIRDLISATDRIAKGDLSVAPASDAPAELGTLVREFGRMAAAVREAQDRLVHSAKLSSVGSLVAGVSHELNNPLLGLLGHAEHLATKFPAGDPAREKLDIVVAEARRMQRTLADLRGFTRPNARERGRVDLNRVAADVVALVQHDARTAGVDCRAELSPSETPVTGSPDELRQVVLNLALNALQATPADGRVKVSTANGGGRCRLVVTDTGAGIAPELLAKVREPFFSTKPGRMGLGLSISQEIVAAHGGELTLESAAGSGTRVTVSLPVAA